MEVEVIESCVEVGEVQYGYKMGAGHIPYPMNSNMSPNPGRKGDNDGRQIVRSRYNRMLHNGYNYTCPPNVGGVVQYGYKMEAGHIPSPKDSNMSPNPRRKEEMKVDRSTEVDIIECCIK